MARIFQKYVTEQGRSETPPSIIDSALRQVSSGRKEGDPQPKLGGSSIKMSDMAMGNPKEADTEDDDMDTSFMMKGMRNMVQMFKFMAQMGKMMNG
jgi:hypothetical protein